MPVVRDRLLELSNGSSISDVDVNGAGDVGAVGYEAAGGVGRSGVGDGARVRASIAAS